MVENMPLRGTASVRYAALRYEGSRQRQIRPSPLGEKFETEDGGGGGGGGLSLMATIIKIDVVWAPFSPPNKNPPMEIPIAP